MASEGLTVDGRMSVAAPATGAVVYRPPSQLSMLALMTLILSLTPFLLLPQIASLVTGFLALRKIKRSAGALTGRGLAIGGMCISTCMLLCIVGVVGLVLVTTALYAS